MRHNYIVIEGNIGAGKTSLSKMLAEEKNGRLVQEAFADNPFLPKFYKDRSKYAFSLEMSFLAERYQQTLDQLYNQDLFSDFTVADYFVTKSLIFAKVNLEEEEFKLYRKFFEIMYQKLPKPDLLIYLHRKPEYLIENINKRGRAYELDIPDTYLQEVQDSYFSSFKSHEDYPIVVVNIEDKNFIEDPSIYNQLKLIIDDVHKAGISVKNLV